MSCCTSLHAGAMSCCWPSRSAGAWRPRCLRSSPTPKPRCSSDACASSARAMTRWPPTSRLICGVALRRRAAAPPHEANSSVHPPNHRSTAMPMPMPMPMPSSLKPIAASVLSLCLAAGAAAQSSSVAEQYGAKVSGLVNDMYPQIETVYQDIHAHPELGFQETRTAAKLAAEMRALGFQVTEKIGKTGVVAIFKNGTGPTVMVRTELDALPMEEKTGLPYASTAKAKSNGRESFVAHSCGHDIHMAAWLSTARTLLALKAQWRGTLMFVAQPAEELVGGAKAMLADGLFTRFGKPDFAFALHTSPAPYGTVAYNVGPITSNSDGMEITFKGRGGHGSAPDKTIDPI